MPYSKFTLSKAVEDFQLTIIEGDRFLPKISPVNPTSLLKDTLKETLPWAIAVGSWVMKYRKAAYRLSYNN
jgi:hypothetical protein